MQIITYLKLSDMTGQGEEWLVEENGEVRAVFIDGNLKCTVLYLGNNHEVTKILAA